MNAIPKDSTLTTAPPYRCAEALTVVRSNAVVNTDYRLLTLDAPAEVLDCAPGQFFQLLCPGTADDQPFLRRPMSIFDFDAATGSLRFLYKVTGAGTRGLATLRPGDRLNVLGPLGQGFSMQDDWQRLMLVARGVGLATLAPLARMAQAHGRQLTAICSARAPEFVMSVDHFRECGAEVIVVTDTDGSSSPDAMRALIEARIAHDGVDAFYTCGSARLARMLQDIGAEYDIPGEIAVEQQMACGLGMCQACVRPFHEGGKIVHRRVCREGPVFQLKGVVA
ncbi:dihydroorotate dehydrogenase electron transfer subunit [Roseicitreum antarcticum]|uniref:Dihydroorotate dehydrogenase electron transfer subunit n=1 Tax=Roseicitreum antarcticum TaxID=564137 RepID=A0A1H2YSH1_9RHOB|nr:dihydroorotate dehydrogenase electron transfer subunit [Roseicitreum antarcticum]SDX07489.1 dihydroorotate dehydrogenase electron transfer subunit [Roseicitreum antarcticum]